MAATVVALALAPALTLGATMTVDGLKELIARELPIGSRKEEVMKFIKTHELDKDTAEGQGFFVSETNAVRGMLRDVRRSLFGLIKTDIVVVFYLNDHGNLKSYEVKEVHTGP